MVYDKVLDKCAREDFTFAYIYLLLEVLFTLFFNRLKLSGGPAKAASDLAAAVPDVFIATRAYTMHFQHGAWIDDDDECRSLRGLYSREFEGLYEAAAERATWFASPIVKLEVERAGGRGAYVYPASTAKVF